MLYLRSTTYDLTTRVLTADYRTPSGTGRRTVEYRDVSPAVFARVEAARPHAHRVLVTDVAPVHDQRRAGATAWTPPERP